MSRPAPVQGELQHAVLEALWRGGEGTVEQVRQRLRRHGAVAYTTVQTVLNRLAERGLVDRRREGPAFVYAAALDEGEYVANSLARSLAAASPSARTVALAHLVEGLDGDDLERLASLARRVAEERDG